MKKPLNFFLGEPLLIRPEALQAFASEEKIKASLEGINDFLDEDRIFQVKDRVSIIDCFGAITQKGHFLSFLFGECSLDSMREKIQESCEDPKIDTVLLNIDSPGGSIFGLMEFCDFLFSMRSKKKLIAISNTSACSAAYLIGCCCHEFYVSDMFSLVGSIGVIATHRSITGALEKAGLKITEVTSTPEKNILSGNKILSEDGEKFLQKQVDVAFNEFIDRVALYRGLDVALVREKMTGLTYFGQEAIDLKFVDGILSIQDFFYKREEEKVMDPFTELKDLVALESKYPAFYATVIKPALESEYKSGKTDGLSLGTRRERLRIKSIEDCTLQGGEKSAYDAKFNSVMTSEQFTQQQFKAMAKKSKINPLSSGVIVSNMVSATGEEDRKARRFENMKRGQILARASRGK